MEKIKRDIQYNNFFFVSNRMEFEIYPYNIDKIVAFYMSRNGNGK